MIIERKIPSGDDCNLYRVIMKTSKRISYEYIKKYKESYRKETIE